MLTLYQLNLEKKKNWFEESISNFQLSCRVPPKTKSKHWHSLFEILSGYLGNSPVSISFDLWIDLFKGRRIWTQDYFQDIHSKSQINCVNVSILFWGGLGMTIENLKSILRINFFSSPNSVDTRSAKATFMAKHCTRKCTIFRVYVHSLLRNKRFLVNLIL